jgi:DNA polymerase
MFIGEGPGYDEDVQGEPFVGKAGQLLNKIIQAIDMRRDEVYIANVVKCRPPGNRDPEPDEVATCRPFLERQIRFIRPVVICTLGRVAIQALLSTEKPLRELRGTTIELGDALVVPTYHPAYLLRYPEKKRDCWEDMKLVRRLLHERR